LSIAPREAIAVVILGSPRRPIINTVVVARRSLFSRDSLIFQPIRFFRLSSDAPAILYLLISPLTPIPASCRRLTSVASYLTSFTGAPRGYKYRDLSLSLSRSLKTRRQ